VAIPLADTAKIGPVNNFFHSIFQQVQVKFRGTPVENSNSSYAYKAYLQNLLYASEEQKTFILYNEMFEADTPGFFEKTEIDIPKHELAVEQAKATWVLPKNTINEGFIIRRKRFFSTNSKEVELVGKLHLDLASTPKYYLNLIEVEIALTRANEKFYLIGDSNVTDKYVVNIRSARLHSRVVAINPDIGLAHTTGLLKANAIYPYEHVIVNSTPIVAGSNKLIISNIHNGIYPNAIYIGFVDSRGFAGTLNYNPFNFQHFYLKEILVTVGATNMPYQKAPMQHRLHLIFIIIYFIMSLNKLNK